jgi:L-histidine Nalpha-methyltransferase
MSTAVVSRFASDVADGLGSLSQKKLSPSYLYDELGSALFEAITFLPEYGLTRADERLLATYSTDIARLVATINHVSELGSGSGRKTRYLIEALRTHGPITYSPIDISPAALASCAKELADLATVEPVCADWMEGLRHVAENRQTEKPMLLLFLGSSIGNLEPDRCGIFLKNVRNYLLPGDFLLLGADLVKDVDVMLTAYDDPTGVTAAFNLNLLGRMNRELGANFDLRSFAHEVRWDAENGRIEMHLLSRCNQRVFISALESEFTFVAGETIWTESSHKFTLPQLEKTALLAGFCPVSSWIDSQWPFAEVLWKIQSK